MKKRVLLILAALLPLFTGAQSAFFHTIRFEGEYGLQQFLHYQAEDALPLISAHRGGRHIPGYPENAVETFAYVLQHTPAIIEFDVNMTRDSVLILLHDYSLDRTTTGTGKVASKDWEEIRELRLIDDFGDTTDFQIPLYRDALIWAKQKTVLTVDVKRGVPYEKVIELIEETGTENYAAVITYNIDDALKVNRLNPDLMISVSIRNEEELNRVEDSGLPFNRIIAFTGTREPDPSLYEALHERGVMCILGTLGNLDQMAEARGEETYRDFIRRGADILATDRPIEAAQAIVPMIPEKSSKKEFLRSH